MKNLFKYTVSFAMILILLVSTLQFSVYKMECLLSGNTQISLSDFNDCNEQKSDCSISDKCCAFNSFTFDFDFDSNANNQNVKVLTSSFTQTVATTSTNNRILPKSDFNFYTNLPPPSGYELLKIVQVFRI